MLKAKAGALMERVKNNAFIKSVLTLSAGVAASQAVALFTTPIISRIFDSSAIGDFTIIVSNASLISAVVCLGMLSAVMIPKEDADARAICRLLLFSIVGLSTVFLAVLLALADVWQMFSVDLDYRLACVILYLFLVTRYLTDVAYAYVNRQKLYRVLFWNPLIGTVSNAAISIGLGLLGCGMWGYALGNIVSALLKGMHLLTHANPFARGGATLLTPAQTLRKYREFPLFVFPRDVVAVVSTQLPVQLIGRLFGSAALGAYSMCLTILGLPSKFLAIPINRVYYKEAAERHNQGQSIGELSYKVIATNIKLAMAAICILIVFGEPVFAFVLGEKWRQAGTFASILGGYQLVLFCSNCISGGLIIIGKQKLNLAFSILSICINLFSFLFGYYYLKSIEGTLIVYAAMNTVFKLVENGAFLHCAGVRTGKYISFVALYILAPLAASITIRFALQRYGVI